MENQKVITINPGESVTIQVGLGFVKKDEYTISEFANATKMARSTVYSKIKNGEISVSENKKTPRISHEQLINFLK